MKLKTETKKVVGNTVEWYEILPPVPIPEMKEVLTVRVMNKQYFSYFDDLIGEGEIEVTHSGNVAIPLQLKGRETGTVWLKVHLI